MANPHSKTETRGSERRRESQFSAEEIAQARAEIKRAFELAGLVSPQGHAVCPKCGKTGRNKVKLYPQGGWHCFSGNWCHGTDNSAVDLLLEQGWNFTEAVAGLLGRPVPQRTRNTAPTPVISAEIDGFKAVCDTEVYDALRAFGDLEAAKKYFARWHISGDAVAELGSTMITNPGKVQAAMLAQFGRERLIASGVLSPGENDRPDYWTVGSEHYPVLEPHRDPHGRTVGLQARPSLKREARYKAHLTYAAAKKEAEARGESFRDPEWNERYVGKFSSLRGGQTGVHLIGGGLPRIAKLENGATVYVVEGLKDLLAMRTLGFEAYALPGVGVTPPAVALAQLGRMNLALAFDADEGGDTGTARLTSSLARAGIVSDELMAEWRSEYQGSDHQVITAGLGALGLEGEMLQAAAQTALSRLAAGLRCWRKRPPQGMDVADVLVSRHAAKGCRCATCRTSRGERTRVVPVPR
jgi:hypothetical protein